MEIGSRLKKARAETELTQEKVAEELGVSRQSVSNWENNRSYPDIVSVIKMSDLYSVSLDELLKEDENMIKHLDEATNEVKSRKRFTKNLIIGAYGAFWVLVILYFWLIKFNFGTFREREEEQLFYIVFPLCGAVISGFIGASESFGKLRWVFLPVTGLLNVLLNAFTWNMGLVIDVFYTEKTPFDFFWYVGAYFSDLQQFPLTLVLCGAVGSALGMFIGTFVRYFRIIRTMKKQEHK